jgi:hypothetical protein
MPYNEAGLPVIDMKIGPDERTRTAVDDIEEDWVKTCFRHLPSYPLPGAQSRSTATAPRN